MYNYVAVPISEVHVISKLINTQNSTWMRLDIRKYMKHLFDVFLSHFNKIIVRGQSGSSERTQFLLYLPSEFVDIGKLGIVYNKSLRDDQFSRDWE
jgi:hypothetical protein